MLSVLLRGASPMLTAFADLVSPGIAYRLGPGFHTALGRPRMHDRDVAGEVTVRNEAMPPSTSSTSK